MKVHRAGFLRWLTSNARKDPGLARAKGRECGCKMRSFFRSSSPDIIRGVLFIFSKKSVSRGMRIFQNRVSVARLCTGKLLCRMKLLFDVSKFVSDV